MMSADTAMNVWADVATVVYVQVSQNVCRDANVIVTVQAKWMPIVAHLDTVHQANYAMALRQKEIIAIGT